MNNMDIVFRTATYAVIRIGDKHYKMYRIIGGVQLVNEEGEELDIRWLLR